MEAKKETGSIMVAAFLMPKDSDRRRKRKTGEVHRSFRWRNAFDEGLSKLAIGLTLVRSEPKYINHSLATFQILRLFLEQFVLNQALE